MLQNACADKGSVFLRISVICRAVFINAGSIEGSIRLEKCSDFRLFVPKKCNKPQLFAWKSVNNYPKTSDGYLFRRVSRIVICSKIVACGSTISTKWLKWLVNIGAIVMRECRTFQKKQKNRQVWRNYLISNIYIIYWLWQNKDFTTYVFRTSMCQICRHRITVHFSYLRNSNN